MKKLLITGANGFIGRYVQPLLEDFEVHAIQRPTSALDRHRSQIQWHNFDLLTEDPKDLVSRIQADYCLHLAWITDHGKFWTHPSNNDWLRVSVDLAKCFYAAGGAKFVFAGSVAEYEWSHDLYLEDQTPTKPSTLYGQTKLAFSQELKKIAQSHSKAFAVGRLFFPYGPGEPESRLIPSAISSLTRNEPFNCTDGRQIRDFIYAEDAAEALVQLVEQPVNGVVNIASGSPVSIRELLQTLASLMKKDLKANFGAISRSNGDPDKLIADTSRLFNDLDWRPRFSLEDGLAKMIQFYEPIFKKTSV